VTGIDPAEVGREAMALMDQLNLNELPEGAFIDEVVVIAAVVFPTGNPEEIGTNTFWRSTTARPWTVKGLLRHVEKRIDEVARRVTPEDFRDA
jgi:hypothetical protein